MAAQTQTAPRPEANSARRRQPLQRRAAGRIALRLVVDALAVSTALLLSSIIRFELLPEVPAARFDYALIVAVATVVWVLLFWLYGLYEPRQVLSPVNELKQTFHGVVGGTVAIFLADSLFNLNLSRGWILLAMGLGFLVVGLERLLVRKTLHFLRRRGGDATRTIILGTNHEAKTMARTLERERWLGYRIVGFVDDQAPIGQEVTNGHEVIGAPAQLQSLVHSHDATLVLVAASAFEASKINRLFWELQTADVDLQVTTGTIELLASRMTVQSVAGVPLLYVRRAGMNRFQKTTKRTIDLVVSGLLIVALSPFLAAIALWIKRDSSGSVFFTQQRSGRDGAGFKCWKFRTMVADAEHRRAALEHLSEGPGLLFKLRVDPRVTRAGKVLRRYSLDELPQLFNVLRGEMSLVGPRPALPGEVEQYDEWIRNRLSVKPGMTGLWQVSGRTETSFSEYIRFDLFYIQNWSLSLDLWILWRTFRAVTSTEGAH